MMNPDPSRLVNGLQIETPLIGLYDCPDPSPFEPLNYPLTMGHSCVFASYQMWLKGVSLHLTKENFGCGGAGYYFFKQQGRTREEFIKFLVKDEGLKESEDLMERWLKAGRTYEREHPNLVLGPLKNDQYKYLKTITFLVKPDQLAGMVYAASYYQAPEDPPAIIAPFGSGCSQLIARFQDLTIPQAVIGSTDIAMRQFLPVNIIAFTVTRPMYERLCRLDDRSFLAKPFLKNLIRSRNGKL